MTDLFLKLLNMSLSASWLVVAVLLLRFLLRKTPKWVSCLLWGIVALRLVMPFAPQSVLSLIPSAEVIPQNIAVSNTPAIHSGIPAVNSVVNPALTTQVLQGENPLEKTLLAAAAVWLTGVGILLLYGAVSYWQVRRQVRVSLRCEKNVYECDEVRSPFILGTLFPRIYVPSGMEQGRLQYVLAHETAHLKRGDHWWKPLGFLLLSVYWFNPLLWVAYILLCRDIERACDEKVITAMDNAGKRAYSEALLACSVHRRMVMACPVAFGEVGVKTRIKGILSYKKPAFWLILASVAACTVTAVCFLTNPVPCSHDYVTRITVSSTCTERGVEMRTCRLCEYCYTVPAPLLEHSYDEGVVVTEPSCIQLGKRLHTCTGCGAQKTEEIAKTGHIDGVPFLSKGPNCSQQGEMSAECIVCHAVYVVEILETNGVHQLEKTVLQAATCTAPGEGIITCTRCDFTQSCTYPQLPHNYQAGPYRPSSCSSNGTQEMTCIDCGHRYWRVFPRTDDHQWVDGVFYYNEYCQLCQKRNPDRVSKNTKKQNDYCLPDPFNPKDPVQPSPVIVWDLSAHRP